MRTSLITLAAALLATGPAIAQDGSSGDLSYTWLEADWTNVDVDVADDDDGLIDDFDDGDGWAIRGSFAFTPNFFGFAGYSETDSDATFVTEGEALLSSSQDAKRLTVGLGGNFPVDFPMAGQSDIVARAAYVDIDFDDFDFGGTDDSDLGDLDDDSSDGYFVDAALRSQLASWAEASLGVRYTDIEDADDFSVIANVLLEINQQWGVNLEADAGDDLGFYLIGLRYSFNRF